MRRTALALAGLVATGVLLGAATFGEPDGNRHPYVGTIIFEATDGYYSCSGTLMSERVFLTAGHCTEAEGVTNARTWAKFAPAISFPGFSEYPSIAAYLDDPANGWVKGDAVPHPQYDGSYPATYDVGVVLLRKRVASATYGALPPLNFLETIQSANENRFTVVGYGLQGFIRPFYGDAYERYQGQVKLIELNSTFNAGMSAKFTNNPGTGGGSCFGDSGGPIFYGSSNTVVSVVSWGITPCIGVDYNFRVDTTVAQEFLRQYIK